MYEWRRNYTIFCFRVSIFTYFVCLCVDIPVWMKVRGYLSEVSCLLSCGSQALNSSHQDWQQTPLPADPSWWSWFCFWVIFFSHNIFWSCFLLLRFSTPYFVSKNKQPSTQKHKIKSNKIQQKTKIIPKQKAPTNSQKYWVKFCAGQLLLHMACLWMYDPVCFLSRFLLALNL